MVLPCIAGEAGLSEQAHQAHDATRACVDSKVLQCTGCSC